MVSVEARRWEWPWSIASALVAAESEKAVLQALRNLDEQDGIIRRYGRLEALRGEGYRRHGGGFYPNRSYLMLPRVLVFEKAEARVDIFVQYGPILRVQIEMFPTQEYVEEHREISLEIVGSEIEYVGGPPDAAADAVDEPVGPQIESARGPPAVDELLGPEIESVEPDVRRKSMIHIEVDHPEFRGE